MPKLIRHKDEQLLLAIACGANQEAASRQTGLSMATICRRMREPDFVRRLSETRREMIVRATSMMTASAMEAVRTLVDLLKPNTPHAVRLGSARTLLELGLKFREEIDLSQRLNGVEKQLGMKIANPASRRVTWRWHRYIAGWKGCGRWPNDVGRRRRHCWRSWTPTPPAS